MREDAQRNLDRLPGAVGDPLGKKAVRGIGYLILGLGYVLTVVIWFGSALAFGSWFAGSSLWSGLQDGGGVLIPFIVISLWLGGFFGALYIAVLVSRPIAGLGARIADPDAQRDLGVLAPKPYVSSVGYEHDRRMFLSPQVRARLDAEKERQSAQLEREHGLAESIAAAHERVAGDIVQVLGAERAEAYRGSLAQLGDGVVELPPFPHGVELSLETHAILARMRIAAHHRRGVADALSGRLGVREEAR